ncbi:MAG TPA: S8 family serine peptidase [Vicinamibacterales bacterium]|nr:S8 family serine peptidase [Vicinamibacterales bacterium]
MTRASQVLSISSLTGRTGQGVRIAVIDSGVHDGHPHVGSITGAVAFDEHGQQHGDVVDRLGHGTAVAAAIHEKAPEAALVAIKIFGRSLTTTGAALAAAIQFAIGARADIINLSLGTSNPEHRQHLEAVVAQATSADVAVVAAAPDAANEWLPGALPGVIGVELDWTCPREECVVTRRVDGEVRVRASGFPRPIPGVPPERNLKGQSFAVANATGLIALAYQGVGQRSRAILFAQ